MSLNKTELALLNEVFNIAIENFQYDNETDNENNAIKLLTKLNKENK